MKDIYDTLRTAGLPVVIYGMGNGADKIFREFSTRGISVSAVIASDDFVRGQSFHGFTVIRLSDAEKLFDRMIVIAAFGTCIEAVMNRISDISKKHTLFVPDVPVYGDNVWDRDFYEQNKNDIQRAYELFADSRSKDVYEKIIRYKLSGELSELQSAYSGKEEVFSELLNLSENESYLDLGAYRGDTIDELLHYTNGKYGYITALEPDRKTFAKLREHTAGMDNIRIYRMGIWSDDTDIPFGGSLGRGSAIKKNGTEMLPVTKIDTLYKRRRVSYIKMDVEGSEKEALLGGIQTLRRDRPKLNIAVYHRSEDIFSMPLLLHSIVPEYRLYLRQHPYIPAWDLNLYALTH